MALETTPTQAGFLAFLRGTVGLTTTVLPDNSPYIPQAYELSLLTVNLAMQGAVPQIYVLCVYNLGADIIFNIAPDQSGQTFFVDSRAKYNINGFVSGVIQSSSDEGTSESMVVPDSFSNFTLGDLQNLKTPWGRFYIAQAQKYGSLWGLS